MSSEKEQEKKISEKSGVTKMRSQSSNNDETSRESTLSIPAKRLPEEYDKFIKELSTPFAILDPVKEFKWGYLLARDISLEEYNKFLDMNDFIELGLRLNKEINADLFDHQVILTIHSTESFIHNEICCEFATIYRIWGDSIVEVDSREFSRTINCQLRTVNCSFTPDAQLGICGRPRIIVEVAYSQTLSHVHKKMQTIVHNVTFTICESILKIKCPWNKLTKSEFDLNDGVMIFLYYTKPENYGHPDFPDIPTPSPDTIINFGSDVLTVAEIEYIIQETNFQGEFQGWGFTATELCHMRNLDAYKFEIPAEVTLELDGRHGETITGHLMEYFPTIAIFVSIYIV
jgi:hypothetical protein